MDIMMAHWCEFCRMVHTSASCYHPGRNFNDVYYSTNNFKDTFMSGGHFDYNQYRLNDISYEIQKVIGDNERYKFSDQTIEEFKKAIHYLKIAETYTQRVDWLISGDDSEESFHSRLKQELESIK